MITDARTWRRANTDNLRKVRTIVTKTMDCCPITGNLENRHIKCVQAKMKAKSPKCHCQAPQHPVLAWSKVSTEYTRGRRKISKLLSFLFNGKKMSATRFFLRNTKTRPNTDGTNLCIMMTSINRPAKPLVTKGEPNKKNNNKYVYSHPFWYSGWHKPSSMETTRPSLWAKKKSRHA